MLSTRDTSRRPAPVRSSGGSSARATADRGRRRHRRGARGVHDRWSPGSRPGPGAPSSPPPPTPTGRPARRSPPPRTRSRPGPRRSRRRRPRTAGPRAAWTLKSSSAQASAQRPGSVTDGSYGNSALRTSPPSGVSRRAVSMTTSRRASPMSFTPSTSEYERGSTNSARSAARHAAATSATNRSWSCAFVRVRVVVDEELGGRGAHPLRLLDAPAVEDAADPRRRRSQVARRLDGHDEA